MTPTQITCMACDFSIECDPMFVDDFARAAGLSVVETPKYAPEYAVMHFCPDHRIYVADLRLDEALNV